MSPETMGDTASGRSISVIRKLLPRNSNFAMHHAAVIPNSVLSGTTTAAVMSVSRIAARVSGSPKLLKYACQPLDNAVANTAANGAASSAPRKVSDTVISTQRISVERRLVCPGRLASSAASSAALAGPAISGFPCARPSSRHHHSLAAPQLQQVDGQQHHERDRQHH